MKARALPSSHRSACTLHPAPCTLQPLSAPKLFQRRIGQKRRPALDVVLADEAVDLLDHITGQGHVDLLGLAQIRRDIDIQHAPAHALEIGVGAVFAGGRGQGNGVPGSGQLFEHDVGNLDGRAIGGFEGVASGNSTGDVGNLDAGGGVFVAPFDADGILHGDLLNRCEGGGS